MGHSKSLKISIVTGALGFPRSLPLSAAGEAARQGRMVASTAAISFIYTFYVGGAVVGSFRRGPGKGQKWRTGCEGRISLLKRRHGLRRSLYKKDAGLKRWVGFGAIADNLISIGSALAGLSGSSGFLRLRPPRTAPTQSDFCAGK